MTILKKSMKIVVCVLLLYIVYVFVATIFVFGKAPKVSQTASEKFAEETFYGEAPGMDRICLVEEPAESFSARLAVIQKAQKELDISYHTIKSGDGSLALLTEVAQAADRGVRVRLIVDGKVGVLSGEVKAVLQQLAVHENITIKKYLPWDFLRPWTFQVLLHDKFIVADDAYLLLGGRNIGDQYFAPAGYTGKVVNDRDVLIAGGGADSVIPAVKAYMEMLWQDSASVVQPGKELTEAKQAALARRVAEFKRLNPAFYQKTLTDFEKEMVATAKISLIANPLEQLNKEPWVGYQMAQAALKAETSVVVQTPYATANPALLKVMTKVAEKVPLNYQTNSLASTPNYPGFSNYYSQRNQFLATGADLYEYQSRDSLHAKSLVVDQRLSFVGSYNLDNRSFHLDTETMLVIDSPEFAQILTKAIEKYQASSLQVLADGSYQKSQEIQPVKVSTLKKIVISVVGLFSRLFEFLI